MLAAAIKVLLHGGIEHLPARPADVRRHCADVQAAEAVLGPIATTTLDDGLAETVAWYRQQGPR